LAQVSNGEPLTQTSKIETNYDSGKNKTTVRMAPMKIADEKGLYHSIHLAPAYSYEGRQPRTPEIIDFEVQTVVKARRLKVDLYVLFLIDGEKIFLSSNRRGVKNPLPGRRWVGESLVFRMPLETMVKLANAKQAKIRMDGLDFELSSDHLSALREFAEMAAHKARDEIVVVLNLRSAASIHPQIFQRWLACGLSHDGYRDTRSRLASESVPVACLGPMLVPLLQSDH
jgi:hypothetical protein